MRVSRCDLVAEREAVPNSPAYFAEGIKEVRSPGRTKERKGAGGDSALSCKVVKEVCFATPLPLPKGGEG